MARKKSVSNQSARREEIVDYDVKRLRQMSAKMNRTEMAVGILHFVQPKFRQQISHRYRLSG